MAAYQGSKGAGLDAQPPKGAIPFEEYAFADMFADDGDVKYSPRNSSNPDTDSIKEQLRRNQEKLDAMSPVHAKQIFLPKARKEDLVKWAKNELASTGYQVDRQNFGRIEFDEKRIDISFDYLNTPGEYAAILAVPRVLKRGIIVGQHASHKYRGFPTVTFAAPVEINGVRGNMAVVVKQESRNVYKTHRILMPDGSAFEYKENAELTPARGVARNGSYASPISSASTDIVAQNPEDVKFSLREPIENSGNLIAVHNLTEEKLRKALKLGGFPMPSIAIAKTDIGHQNFGGVSLVFGKDTIDPKADRKNKVYSADVWSPTFPRIEYEADAKVENRVREALNDLGDRMETYLHEQLKRVVYGIDEYLNRFEGEEGFIEWAVNNYGLKAAFLEDQGQHVGMVKVEKPVGKSYSEGAATVFQQVIDLFGGDMESAQKLPLTQIRE